MEGVGLIGSRCRVCHARGLETSTFDIFHLNTYVNDVRSEVDKTSVSLEHSGVVACSKGRRLRHEG